MRKLLFSIFILTFIFTLSYAAEYPYIMKSPRALGMGDAFYTLSDDQYATFYNPAGLSNIKKWRVDLINPQLGVAQNTLDFYDDVKDTDWDSEQEVADLLRKYIGENQHASLGLFPAFYKKNLLIGAFANARLNAIPRNRQYPYIQAEAYFDRGLVAGISRSFLKDDALSIGITGKYLFRSAINEKYTVVDLADDDFDQKVEDDLKDGSGVLFDVGAIYRFKNWFGEPKIAAAVKNIGSTDLGDAPDLKTTLNLGVGISPKLGFLESDIMFDIRDVTQAYDEDDDWGKRMHFGLEVRPVKFKILSVRAGMNQGYLTYGATLNLYLVKITYAYYKEEIGAEYKQWDDERHMLQITIGF